VDPDSSTTYFVRAEGDCNFTDSVSTSVTVFEPSITPVAIDITNDSTCHGTIKELTVIGGLLGEGAEWIWYSDPDLSMMEGSGPGIQVDPDSSTRYYVRAEGACNTTDTIGGLVTVKRESMAPESASVDSNSFCAGTVPTITLSYQGGFVGDGAEAYWYTDSLFNDPSIASGNDVIIPAPASTTLYYVRFEGDCNITGAASTEVVVHAVPGPSIEGSTLLCVPEETMYTVSGMEGSIFSWSVDDGTILGDTTGTTVTVLWTSEGPGLIRVSETTLNGCQSSADSTVMKYPAPQAAEIMGDTGIVCSGDTGRAYYIEGLENSTFTWIVEEGMIAEEYGDSILVDWLVPRGEYEVSVVEVTALGCMGDTLVSSVTVASPDLDLGGDTYICEGDEYQIDLAGEFSSYLWLDGSTDASFNTNSEGWIGVLVGDEYGCMAQDSIYLTVHPNPVVDLGPDTSLCGDLGLVLDAGPDGVIYDWSTGENSREITIYQGNRKEISVVVEDEFGCIGMDTIVIGSCDPNFYFRDIPTAITPNDDGTNDVWNIVKLEGYSRAEVEIYNRWGTLVWRSEPGYSIPWDGRDMRGNLVPMDSYHFVIKLNVGDVDRITGVVTVIR
jgi:gliding motility-associated-like protein